MFSCGVVSVSAANANESEPGHRGEPLSCSGMARFVLRGKQIEKD